MGGFSKKTKTLDEAANRVLKDLTGLENVYLEQLQAFSDVKEIPRNAQYR
jgi:ADP-ribose pyrophosphatase YjhB (NUDIX family)